MLGVCTLDEIVTSMAVEATQLHVHCDCQHATHSWVSSACSGDICSSSGSSVVSGLSTGTTLVMLRFSEYSCRGTAHISTPQPALAYARKIRRP